MHCNCWTLQKLNKHRLRSYLTTCTDLYLFHFFSLRCFFFIIAIVVAVAVVEANKQWKNSNRNTWIVSWFELICITCSSFSYYTVLFFLHTNVYWCWLLTFTITHVHIHLKLLLKKKSLEVFLLTLEWFFSCLFQLHTVKA